MLKLDVRYGFFILIIWLNFQQYLRLGSEDKETTCSVPILSLFVFVKGARSNWLALLRIPCHVLLDYQKGAKVLLTT